MINTIEFIDTHTHLFSKEFAEDIDEVMERAKEAGAKGVFLPNINMASISPMMNLCERYPNFALPMIGLHPTDVNTDYEVTLAQMKSLLDKPHSFIAIGEVGLDLYWDKTHYNEQVKAFETQIVWAIEQQLPLMIHTREAHGEMVKILSRYREENITGVFHSFGGNAEEAAELLTFEGFTLGINGVVTFKKSPLPDTLKSVPLERLVIETDSPYLAPVPHRGKRNESSYAKLIIERIANLYEVSADVVAKQTLATSLDLFKKAKLK